MIIYIYTHKGIPLEINFQKKKKKFNKLHQNLKTIEYSNKSKSLSPTIEEY